MLEPRTPIVTILGHVDHGKTTLLDALRKTNVAAKEAGGITQSTVASVITTKEGKKITFIDTPGHAAFSQMRSRGAKLADIAVLVVSADDGVKPQTKEALAYVLKEKVPYLVAITKIDLASADPERVKGELEKEGVSFEGKGGNVPCVGVSAKKGMGLEELIETITLVSEVNEIKGDPKADLDAFVVETQKENRGILVYIVVINGSLKVGDKVLVEGSVAKIRGIFDYQNKKVDLIGPGEPAVILGFDKAPLVGAQIKSWKGETPAIEEIKGRKVYKPLTDSELNIVIKAESAGVLEAIKENLPEGVNAITTGVGDVNEGDIFSAKVTPNCRIFAFESRVPAHIKKLSETEGIKIEEFDIIYKLFERLEELVSKKVEEISGKAEVVAIFPFNSKKVAGCKVKEGKIVRGDFLKLIRNEKEIGQAKIISMKREKKNISQALAGEDFGVILEPQLDFTIGDVLLSVRK